VRDLLTFLQATGYMIYAIYYIVYSRSYLLYVICYMVHVICYTYMIQAICSYSYIKANEIHYFSSLFTK